jgi:carboxyl-terminal processing protease
MSSYVKRVKSFLLIISLCCFSGVIQAKDYLFSEEELKVITKLAVNILVREHYLRQPLNDTVSKNLFDEYFKTLDPAKMYLTKADIEAFAPYRDKLDDQLLAGDHSFAILAYNAMAEKLSEFEDYAKKIVADGLDFSEDEEWNPDRADADWPADSAERMSLWKKKIKNDILIFRLMLKTDSGTDKGKNGKEKTLWMKAFKPEERALKRYASLNRYFKENEPIDQLELYLLALTNIYDPYTQYMSPRTVEDFNIQMSLSLEGIGATLSQDDGYTKIVSLVPGGPAALSGALHPEDRIIAVAQGDGESVDVVDMPLSKVVGMIRGEKNTTVRLTVLEGSKGLAAIPVEISIRRDSIPLKDQEAKGEILQKSIGSESGLERKIKIGVINLKSFYFDWEAAENGSKEIKSSTSDVRKILENFEKEKIDALILDLRGNGGGSLYEAISLTGLFIKEGPVVQVKTKDGNVDVKRDTDGKIFYSGPMLVLVNRLSASAAEILAGAIKDYGRGIIIGDSHTHGKGTVQTVFSLGEFLKYWGFNNESGSLKITNAKFYRINGASTQKKGVVPDLIFPSFADSMEIGEEFAKHALDWDITEPVKYSRWTSDHDSRTLIEKLKRLSGERVAKDRDFAALSQKIEKYAELKKKTSVSLNEEKRFQSYMDIKNVLDEQAKLFNLDGEDTDKDLLDEQEEFVNLEGEDLYTIGESADKVNLGRDVYMKEAVNVIYDMINNAGELMKKDKISAVQKK